MICTLTTDETYQLLRDINPLSLLFLKENQQNINYKPFTIISNSDFL
jgi:hypothetical protein